MSDDIDRLKLMLEDFRILKDGIVEGHDAMKDVVAAAVPIELETDPEGHAALRDLARDIIEAYWQTRSALTAVDGTILELLRKARA